MPRGTRGKWWFATALAAIAGLVVAACPPTVPAKPGKRDQGSRSKRPHSVRIPKRVSLPQGFVSVQPPQLPSDEELGRMRQAGITRYRFVFDWNNVERRAGAINWIAYDIVVGDAARYGISVFPVLFGVPRWVSPSPATLPIDTPEHQAAWERFVGAAAQRYGPGGTFWSEHPQLPKRPLVDWEVWNEPNINGWVGGVANAPQYAYFLAVTRNALRAGNPSVRALVAGLFRRPKRRGGQRMVKYLQRLYRVPGFRRSFDGVAIHPYATKPVQALRVTQTVRRIMNRHRSKRKPIWITELGWTTGGSDWAGSLYRATPTSQAGRLSRSLRLLVSRRKSLRLRSITWYSWRDFFTDGLWPNYMGLFTGSGEPKPAWSALLRLTRGQGEGPIRSLGKKPQPPRPSDEPAGPPPPSPRPCFLIFC